MSGVQVGQKPRHPEGKSLSEALREDAERIKARKGLIDKTATLIKAPDDESDAFADLGATMRPSEEQLSRINGFTRKTVTADEVVAFTTLSCNDIIDRDDDQFTTQCVKDFAALEQPFSPVGKSFMLDHAYSVQNAVGRIFGVDTKKVSGATFLTNEVYMPNTEQFAPLIEKIDFGISWAVSVGVMLGKDECSLSWCKAPFSSWGWWCQNGHDKGLFYEKDSDETDSWGYPAPCDPKTKNAEKCVRQFSEPRDMYELSQVFLGAQYFAALEKEPAYASVMKGLKAKDLPVIGLSKEEAKALPLRHEPEKVSEARRTFGVIEDEDGSLIWTDAQKLRWTYDPADPEAGVLSLGKEASTQEEDDDGEHEVPGGPGSEDLGAVDGDQAPVSDPEAGVGGPGDGSDPGASAGELERGLTSTSSVDDEDGASDDSEEGDEETEPSETSDPSDDDEEEATTPEPEGSDETEEEKGALKVILDAARTAKLPQAVIDAAKGADGPLAGLSTIFSTLSAQIESLVPRAALGDQYKQELRATAIDWYTKAHATQERPGVDTTAFEKVLDRCDDDVTLLKQLADEQKDLAQAKFPKSVRRSSFPDDPNSAEAPKPVDLGKDSGDDDSGEDTARKVKRLHG